PWLQRSSGHTIGPPSGPYSRVVAGCSGPPFTEAVASRVIVSTTISALGGTYETTISPSNSQGGIASMPTPSGLGYQRILHCRAVEFPVRIEMIGRTEEYSGISVAGM